MPEATQKRHGTAYAGLDFIKAAFCPLDFKAQLLSDHPSFQLLGKKDAALGELEVGPALHYPRQFPYTDQHGHRKLGTQLITASFGLAPVDFDLFLGLFTYLKRQPSVEARAQKALEGDAGPSAKNRRRRRVARCQMMTRWPAKGPPGLYISNQKPCSAPRDRLPVNRRSMRPLPSCIGRAGLRVTSPSQRHWDLFGRSSQHRGEHRIEVRANTDRAIWQLAPILTLLLREPPPRSARW